MRKQATWIVSLCAALLALHVIGCEQDSASVAVERVALNMTELTLTRGETARLTATVMPENADDKTVTWHSSDTSVAAVGNDGTVTAANAGKTTIYAQAGGMVATCHVTVNPKPAIVESITLSPETLPLTVGTTGYLSAMVVYQDIPDDTTTVAWQWWSSDTSVATVNYDGMITAVAEGTATIYAQAGDKTATCTVTVKPVPVIAVERVTLDKNTITLMRGTEECLTAMVTPDDADDRTVTWQSSDTAVATVDAWGWVTARGVGTATIYARAGNITAECAVTVTPLLVNSITLDHDRLTLKTGQTEKVGATVTPNDADDKTILWSSSDETVATVDSDGTVTARKAGTATITATARAGGRTATCTAFVNPVYVDDITLSPVDFRLRPGMSRRVMATITPENADDKTILWSSSYEAVATVDDDGTVTAVAEGTAIITATATGGNQRTEEKQCWVTVSEVLIEAERVTLNKDALTLTRGETERLTATITPDNADNKTATWWSSDTSVATVDADGTVMAVGKGTATIYAQADNKYATCKVTVNPVLVESVALDKETLMLKTGETEWIRATVTPDNADDKTVTWESSDTTVATVDNDGKVTARKAGTTTITAQVGDKTATCKVTVNPILVESVTLDKETLMLKTGETEWIRATVTPDNADDTAVTWESSDTTVATVDNDGKVTARKAGTTTITAQVGDKTATCKVTVNPILVEHITLDKETLTLTLMRNETGKLTATVSPSNADDKTVTWLSSDTVVATVDNDGTVTAHKAGTADITARVGDKEATCAVTVYLAVDNITLNMTTLTLKTGKTEKLTATVTAEDIRTITWSSSTPSVATVRDDGTVTAHSTGVTTITARAGDKTAECIVTVQIPTMVDGTINLYGVLCRYSGKETTVIIPDGVTGIGERAFRYCTSLTGVTIPTSVTSIGDYAFGYCRSLTGVTIPSSVTSIGEYAFTECTSLTDVTLPSSITSIRNNVFDGCTSLKSVTILGNVTSIGRDAFRNCTSLTDVTIPGSVTSIGSSAFFKCTSLTNVTILDGVKSIREYAFAFCGSLTSVTIPGSVTSIGHSAFYGCTSLTDVTIPVSVTSIGNRTFVGCDKLDTVHYDGTKEEWGKITIDSTSGLSGKTIIGKDGLTWTAE